MPDEEVPDPDGASMTPLEDVLFKDKDPGQVSLFRALQKQNRQRHRGINKKYGQILNPDIMKDYRVEAMFEFLMPRGSDIRFEFEKQWQDKISEALDMLEEQAKEQHEAMEKARAEHEKQLLVPDKRLILPGS